MPSSIASSTMLTVSSSRVRARCARTSPTARRHRHRAQRRRRRRMVGQRKEPGNERSTSRPARPRGSTRTSRARRCVRLVAVTPRRARAPPVDYGDDLSFPGDNCPTNLRPNHCTQRCPHARLEMDRGMTARDQGYKCSRSSVPPKRLSKWCRTCLVQLYGTFSNPAHGWTCAVAMGECSRSLVAWAAEFVGHCSWPYDEGRSTHKRLVKRVADEGGEDDAEANDRPVRRCFGQGETGEEPDGWNEVHGVRSKEVCNPQVTTVSRPAYETGTWRICRAAADEMASAVGHVACHSHRQNEREHEAETNGKLECRVETAVRIAQYEDAIDQSGGGKQDCEPTHKPVG